MTRVELSPASLIVSLKQVASAKTEQDCAQALVSSATLFQEAVLNGQSPESVQEALDACPPELAKELFAVMDRSVNFHLLEDGSTLGLWLLPVVISADQPLPAILPLETTSLNAMKLSGCLLQQLGLSSAMASGNRMGWTYTIPALYSDEQIRNCDVGALITLPHEARAVIRGDLKAVSFDTGADQGSVAPGANLYFLPFVAFAPKGLSPAMPLTSTRTVTRMTQWVSATLEPKIGTDVAIHISPIPQPFSLALAVGSRLQMDIRLREMMMRVCNESGVEPNGLAALVAPYAVRQADGMLMVGVSLVSRLTKNVVATLSLPVESADGDEEVALTTHILKDLGMECIQDHPQPIQTVACQHCGRVQFALPSLAASDTRMAEANPSKVH